MNRTIKGYLFSLLATIAFSNVYIFSKAALREIDLASFGVLWFFLALVWNFLYVFQSKSLSSVKRLAPSSRIGLLAIGVSELISTSAFFVAINLMDNPAMVSFLANTTPIFVALLGLLLLNEKFNFIEVGGILATLAGVVILTSGDIFQDGGLHLNAGTIATLIFAFFYAISTIIAKKHIRDLHPSLISLCRNLFLLLGFGLYSLWMATPLHYTPNGTLNIAIGSFLGPFLAYVLSYMALQYIEATKMSIIISTRSFFILLGAFLYWGILPEKGQILGGTITVLGIIVMSLGERQKRIARQKTTKAM